LAACPVALWIGDESLALRYIRLLEERSATSVLPHWHGYSQVYRQALENPQGRHRLGPNFNYRHREEFSVLGEGLASDDLIERAKSNEPIWCSAEVLRLQAIKEIRGNGLDAADEAVALLSRSREIALQQGALSWELRTSTTLAGILHRRARSNEAFELLQSVTCRFTEGFETADYTKAVTLLREIEAKL
jgi:hypothetical protein